MDWKKKYLKYKTKYLTLKKGGTLETEIIDLSQQHKWLFNVFYIMYNLTKAINQGRINNTFSELKPEFIHVAYDFIDHMIENYELRTEVDTSVPIIKFYFNYNGHVMDLTYDTFRTYVGTFEHLQDSILIIDPPDNKINLVESVIGSALNIGVNSIILSNFEYEMRTNSGTMIYIIDYQNILNILYWHYYPENNGGRNRDRCYEFCADKIANFCLGKIRNGDYVIVIAKPSTFLSEYDIRESFFNNNIDLRQNLNSRFFLINMNLSTNPAQSNNFDDFVFWAIAVSFYKCLEVIGNTNALSLITNDRQSLSDSDKTNTKNIINFNGNSVDNYEYISGNMFNNYSVTVNNSKTTLCTYLNIFREILDLNFNPISPFVRQSNQNLTIAQIYDSVYVEQKDFVTHQGTLIEHIHAFGLNSNLGNNEDSHATLAFFYGAIKYIQEQVFNRTRTPFYTSPMNESMNKSDIIRLFP